ncbi:MAG: hypothetical protein NBKEAIPA_02969 [Nitrospirae bacterium]|nr:hypothetical protein [Nitrospirota bacterium]QOJ33774.1 MAG: AHH domain-containing protein [Nitrospira sp.]
MDIGEQVANAFERSLASDKYCDGKKRDPKPWKSRINEWGTYKDCSGARLYRNMEKDTDKKQGYLGGPTPFIAKPGVTGYRWSFDNLSSTHFPVQAHHLIPKNHLPGHPVCTFLAKGYTKSKKYQLAADTFYDTDHANNGYCLPYATPLVEWRSADGDDNLKLTIAFEVMEITNRQLHQGSHRAAAYEAPVDDDEEARIHANGYLDTVDNLLRRVQNSAQAHMDSCSICKPDSGKKTVQPLESLVQHMDQVSGIIKSLIDANRIFISKPASLWWSDRLKKLALPKWMKGNQPKSPTR